MHSTNFVLLRCHSAATPPLLRTENLSKTNTFVAYSAATPPLLRGYSAATPLKRLRKHMHFGQPLKLHGARRGEPKSGSVCPARTDCGTSRFKKRILFLIRGAPGVPNSGLPGVPALEQFKILWGIRG